MISYFRYINYFYLNLTSKEIGKKKIKLAMFSLLFILIEVDDSIFI